MFTISAADLVAYELSTSFQTMSLRDCMVLGSDENHYLSGDMTMELRVDRDWGAPVYTVQFTASYCGLIGTATVVNRQPWPVDLTFADSLTVPLPAGIYFGSMLSSELKFCVTTDGLRAWFVGPDGLRRVIVPPYAEQREHGSWLRAQFSLQGMQCPLTVLS